MSSIHNNKREVELKLRSEIGLVLFRVSIDGCASRGKAREVGYGLWAVVSRMRDRMVDSGGLYGTVSCSTSSLRKLIVDIRFLIKGSWATERGRIDFFENPV